MWLHAHEGQDKRRLLQGKPACGTVVRLACRYRGATCTSRQGSSSCCIAAGRQHCLHGGNICPACRGTGARSGHVITKARRECLLRTYRQASDNLGDGVSDVPAESACLLKRPRVHSRFGACFRVGSAGCFRLQDTCTLQAPRGHVVNYTYYLSMPHTAGAQTSPGNIFQTDVGKQRCSDLSRGWIRKLPVEPLTARADTHLTAPSPTHPVSAAAPALHLRPLSPGWSPAADQQSGTINQAKQYLYGGPLAG